MGSAAGLKCATPVITAGDPGRNPRGAARQASLSANRRKVELASGQIGQQEACALTSPHWR